MTFTKISSLHFFHFFVKFGMIVVVFDALIWHSWTNAMEPEDIMTSAKGKFFSMFFFPICFPNL